MKLLFYLGHPAHFHLFKNTIQHFRNSGHQVQILIKKKDVLEDLLQEAGLEYINIYPKTRGGTKIEITKTILTREFRLLKLCIKNRPDLLIGTSVENAHVGKILGIPSLNVNEDDFDVVPLYSKSSYPFSNSILCPTTCRTGKWQKKTVNYRGYHELAYLHPNNFTPDLSIASKYVDIQKPYFLIRFAKLSAHHDEGIRGFSDDFAEIIVNKLKSVGNVYITSEKTLDTRFEPYRINIKASEIHHVMSFARLYIGDSQTMAAESGVLGVPFIRFNDFVGRIGYLNELENVYQLGYGISPDNPELVIQKLEELLSDKNSHYLYQARRQKMLTEKIDLNQFLIWFISTFPGSKKIIKKDPSIQQQFILKPQSSILQIKKESTQLIAKS